jgi:Cellulose binding domain
MTKGSLRLVAGGVRGAAGSVRTRIGVLALAALTAAAAGCGGSEARRAPLDAGGSDVAADLPGAGQGGGPGADAGGGGSGGGGAPEGGAGALEGQPCKTAGECASSFCFDGVCCKTDCSGACRSCAGAGSVGTCLPVGPGTDDPRGVCTDEGATGCGHDGHCDGAGSCRFYSNGLPCRGTSCVGSTLTASSRCDGQGACVAASGQPCDPYVCGADAQCLTTCTKDADCKAGSVCTNNRCGLAPIGATCGSDGDCNSGICAQGVCCATACTGTCRSCAVAGSAGTCTNVPAGADPLAQCADGGATTCGTDGTCDGNGQCRNYVTGTVCQAATCAGTTETLPGRCDGAGTCLAGGLVNCAPYTCGSDGTCLAKCGVNADCTSGNFCNGTLCGKKPMGVACTAPNECASSFCEQGICCSTGCAALCQACNLTGTLGTCTAIPVGQDPLDQCADMGAPSCGTDGSCDGAGKCRLYGSGVQCLMPTCSGSTATLAGRCSGTGTCAAGTTQTCNPYVCGGSGSCLSTCATSNDCTAGNVCTAASCGKKPLGATCAAPAECGSGLCEQGVCCGTACTGTCKSCALTGSAGTCSNVSAGQDPLSQCTDAGAASCGTDGTCDGAGACRLYGTGTQCAGATCTGSTFTPPRNCNGVGACAAPAPSSCGNFLCDTAANVCKVTCTADADCVAPNVCTGGVCTKKPLGQTCAAGTECASGLCQQSVCCSSACAGTCRSCALTGSLGTCTNVPVGQDPLNQCTDNLAATCGTDGSCNGSGACRIYPVGTQCAPSTCSGSTFTPARTCDGISACRTVTTSLCVPFACNTDGTCRTTCTGNTDCAAPNVCTGGVCGKLANGTACATNTDCNSGVCAQNICCATACTGTCKSCALSGSLGTCATVAAGQDPLNQCSDAGAASCGTNGSCDGNGACQLYAAGTQCLAQSCSGSTLSAARTCDGLGVCRAAATSSCTPYLCATTACKTTCATDGDCLGPTNVCTGTTCGLPSNLKVQLAARDLTANDAAVAPHYIIFNMSATPVPLSELTIKYWYTIDTNVAQTASVDFAAIGAANVTTAFASVSPAKTGADSVFIVGFMPAAGSVAANGNSNQIQVRFSKNDFSAYNENNDYSYISTLTFVDAPHVTLYRNGTIVWGTEPP